MNKLCPKCLHELQEQERVCPICGTKLKRNYAKFLKIIFSIAIPFTLLISIFFYIAFANSETSVSEKFFTSLSERDVEQLQKLIVHEDGTAISKTEAKAVIALIENLGEIEVEKFFFPVKNNSLFNLYKMTAKSVSFTSLKAPFSLHLKDASFHNLIPGKYTVQVLHKGTLTSNIDLQVAVTKKNTELPQKLQLRKISLEDSNTFPIQFFNQIKIKMNDSVASLSELAKEKDLSVFNYQIPQYEIIATWPWGEVSSNKKTLVNNINISSLPTVSPKKLKEFSQMTVDTLTAIGNDKKLPNYLSEQFKQSLPNTYLIFPLPIDLSFLEENSIKVNKKGIANGIGFTTMTADGEHLNIVLGYDEKKKSWFIQSIINLSSTLNNEEYQNEYDENFQDAFYVTIDLATLSPEQLIFLFGSIYKDHLMYYRLEMESVNKKVDAKLYGCSNGEYDGADIKSVKILNKDRVELQTIDTCQNNETYATTTIFQREPINYWQVKSIESRKKLNED